MIEKSLELKQKEYDTKSAGRIDLLCIDRNRDFVVIETKKGKESDKVVGPIQRYMGWITRKKTSIPVNIQNAYIS